MKLEKRGDIIKSSHWSKMAVGHLSINRKDVIKMFVHNTVTWIV